MRLDWQLMRVALAQDGRCPHTPQLQIGVRAAQICDLTLIGALVDTADGAQLRATDHDTAALDSPLLRVLQAGHAVIPWDHLFYNQLGDVPHGTRDCTNGLTNAAIWHPVDGHHHLLHHRRYVDTDEAARQSLKADVVATIDRPSDSQATRLRVLAYLADASQLFGPPALPDSFDLMHRHADGLHLSNTTVDHALRKALWAAANDWHRAVSGFGIGGL